MPRKKDVEDEKLSAKDAEDRSSLLKRLMETGLDVFGQTEDGLKQILADFSLPKEFVKYLIKSTDRARTEIVRIVGKEFK